MSTSLVVRIPGVGLTPGDGSLLCLMGLAGSRPTVDW